MHRTCRYAFLVVLATWSITITAMETTWAYRIKLTKNTGGLDIVADTFTGPAAIVGLKNRSGKIAFCTASFVSYPHSPTLDETRSVTLAPGKNAALAYPAKKLGGNFSTVFVDLNCSEKKPISKDID